LTLHFGQQGYEVTAISSSQAALFIVPEEPFDLYILGLPRKAGAALCRKIRESEKHARIIMLSDASQKSEMDAAPCVGCAVFVAENGIDHLLDRVRVELNR
jgi:DNA-binding response OmpR family regulator